MGNIFFWRLKNKNWNKNQCLQLKFKCRYRKKIHIGLGTGLGINGSVMSLHTSIYTKHTHIYKLFIEYRKLIMHVYTMNFPAFARDTIWIWISTKCVYDFSSIPSLKNIIHNQLYIVVIFTRLCSTSDTLLYYSRLLIFRMYFHNPHPYEMYLLYTKTFLYTNCEWNDSLWNVSLSLPLCIGIWCLGTAMCCCCCCVCVCVTVSILIVQNEQNAINFKPTKFYVFIFNNNAIILINGSKWGG